MQENLYEKYGGFEFFHNCIYGLYLDMFDHPEISYHFIGVNIEKLSKHQTQFLVRAIGGPDLYEGGSLLEVHAKKNITRYEFVEIAKSFKAVFIKNGVSPIDADYIMKFVASFEKEIVTKKITSIDLFVITLSKVWRKIKSFFS